MANRYWVGGTATWDAIVGTKWALTSGGAGGQAVPTSADDVFFDASSGNSTVSISGTASCKTLTTTGFTGGSASISGTLEVSGNVTLNKTSGWTSLTITTLATGTTTVPDGTSISNITVNGVGITTTLITDVPTNGYIYLTTVTITNGILDISNLANTTAGGLFIQGTSSTAFSSSNSNTRGIAFGSSGFITMNNGGISMSTATNFTYTGTSKITGRITGTSDFGSVAGATSTNAMNFTNIRVSSTSSLNITANNWTCDSTLSQDQRGFITCYGNVVLNGTGTTGFSSLYVFMFGISKTLTTNGFKISSLYIGDGTVTTTNITLSDTLLANGVGGLVTLSSGTFNTNNFNVTGDFQSKPVSNATRTLNMGSSTWTTIRAAVAVWDTTATGLTINAGTSTLSIGGDGSKLFNSIGFTYYNFLINSTGQLFFNGSNTYNNFSNTTTLGSTTIRLTAGTTQTATQFTIGGKSNADPLIINSQTAGTRANLSQASGVVTAVYLTLLDNNATGGATFTALYSTNSGNNLGWTFLTGMPLTGVFAAGNVGTFSIGKSLTLSGVTSTNAVQSFASYSFSRNISGVGSNLSVGTVSYAASLVLTGVFAQGDVGQIVYHGPWTKIETSQTPNWSDISTPSSVTWSSVTTNQTPNWTNNL